MWKFKKYGFTLAEVIIVIGIIGVVAAITIPILNNNITNREIVSHFKKDFSVLSSTVLMIQQDGGGSLGGAIGNTSSTILTNLAKYIKFTKICSTNAYTEGCADWVGVNAANVKMLTGGNFGWTGLFTIPGAIMPDGSLLLVDRVDSTCTNTTYTDTGLCAQLTLDVNGSKSPNIYGRDILSLYITAKGVFPRGSCSDRATTDPTNYGCRESSLSSNGEGCATRILREDAINY